MIMNRGFDFYQPEDNCRFAKYFLRMLFDYKETFKGADIIHFNIGHWDLCQLYDAPIHGLDCFYLSNVCS